jgi:hypothetical protein
MDRLSEVEKYCIAANLAGFGRITGIGPNHLDETPLWLYIGIQKGIEIPSGRQRKLAVDDRIREMKVVVEANSKDDLHFQEILLAILRKYNLTFELRDDKTFVLIPKPKKP